MSEPCATMGSRSKGLAPQKGRSEMADTKHTKRELFETLLVFASAAEADEWVLKGLEHEIELLDRKRATKGVDAKKAAEQRAVMESIEAVLTDSDEALRATAIAEGVGCSVQRASALLRKMVAAGSVTRHEDKKVVTFSLS